MSSEQVVSRTQNRGIEDLERVLLNIIAETHAEIKKNSKETYAAIKKNSKKIRAIIAETHAAIKKTAEQIGFVGNNFGELMESFTEGVLNSILEQEKLKMKFLERDFPVHLRSDQIGEKRANALVTQEKKKREKKDTDERRQ